MSAAYDLDVAYRPEPLTDRGEIELNTALLRRFLVIEPGELVELTYWTNTGYISVAHATNEAAHVHLLREAERQRGYSGAYQLVNGPIDPRLVYRYEPNTWNNAKPGRATDRDVQRLRAIFLDVDPERPKNISSTDAELRQAQEVASAIRDWLTSVLGSDAPLGFGCSGNGYYLLIAIEPIDPTAETKERIEKLVKLINARFAIENVIKIDRSVCNPARLCAAPGTWKRKGRDATERPHRKATFVCRPTVQRVPLEALC